MTVLRQAPEHGNEKKLEKLMKAIIPVAGVGTRLRPFTTTVPKPLLPVAGKPILAHILDSLLSAGIDEIVLVTGYMGDKIQEYVEKNYNVKAQFVEQEETLGLGHAVLIGLEVCNEEPVMIALGDTIIEVGFQDVITSGKNSIGVHYVEDPRRFGVVELDGDRVIGMQEKPEHPKSNMAITSPYFFKNSSILRNALDTLIEKDIKTRGEYQLTDAMRIMLENGEEIYVTQIKGWFDCGTVETLLTTNHHLLEHVPLPEPQENAVLIPPVYIGEDATIEHSVIGPNVSIGENAVIRESVIADSILGNSVEVEHALLKGSVLGNESSYRGSYRKMILGDHSEGGYYEG